MAGKENFHFGKFQPLFSAFATISQAAPPGGNSVGTFSSFFLLFLKAGKRCSCSAAAPSSLTERGASTNGEGGEKKKNTPAAPVFYVSFDLHLAARKDSGEGVREKGSQCFLGQSDE